ncbi:hypothetical protein [Candidatus Mycoplasma mahonii]|nr:hypothetical protein [Candidatus Mycoplasma mahonii]WKX02265.1 hypothetical protein O3I44_02575 [Candidatus Mycoplasma mahonii]
MKNKKPKKIPKRPKAFQDLLDKSVNLPPKKNKKRAEITALFLI